MKKVSHKLITVLLVCILLSGNLLTAYAREDKAVQILPLCSETELTETDAAEGSRTQDMSEAAMQEPELTAEEPAMPETAAEKPGIPEEPKVPQTAEEEPAATEAPEEEPGVPEETTEEPGVPEATEATAEEPEVPEETAEEPAESEPAQEESTEQELTETEEETSEEASSEEAETEEEIPEDDIERILADKKKSNLGEVTQIMQITSCRILGDTVIVQGKINTPFTTWNKTFYLFAAEMYETDISGDPIAETKQADTFRFDIPLNRDTADCKLYTKFFVGVKFRNGDYFALSNGKYITNPEVIAPNQSPYPTAWSKKGLFAETFWGTDLDELGISHATVNLVINEMFKGDGISYTYNGKTYQFALGYISAMDNILRLMQKNNIIVSGILLVRPGEECGDFAFPGISQSIGSYHGWNVVTEEGIECVSAALHFLGERYGRSDNAYGHIANWIVGNEVNADTSWNYTGHQEVSEYAFIYANMLRITYQAVRSSCAHARVFMPLDMFWNNSANSQRYDGKQIVDLVNTYIRTEGNIPWGIAFHPYANPLTETEWWNDHAEQSENAGFISMQNLSVLTDYLQRTILRNPDGSVKHVILSEQGFTSYSSNQGNVEWKQAAAYAYAYYVAEANPYIDAFIVMRQKDADVEAASGLHQGIWYDNSEKDFCTFAKKPVWTVWKYIDTARSFEYTDSLAPLVGLSSFSGTYGSVMASRNRTVTSGVSGYASGFTGSSAIAGSWQGEYMIGSIRTDSDSITVTAGTNSPFTYSGIVWNGSMDFSSNSIFGFDFRGTAGSGQNLRVRMRFSSGRDVYETEVAIKRDTQQKIYADLSGWSGRSRVNRIQIWVQQDGTDLWQNGSFTISDICMASGVSAQSAPTISIKDAGVSGTTGTGFDVYCTTAGSQKLARVEYSAWHVQTGTGSAVTKDGTVSGSSSSAHFDISSFGWKTGAYNVRIVAYDADGIASKETVVNVTVKGNPEALIIYNAYASNISVNGFTLTAEAASDYGLSSSSSAAVWSVDGGQDDIRWYPLSFNSGTAAITIRTADHGYSSGEYMCHIYVKDNAGTQKVFPVSVTVPTVLPTVSSAAVTNVSAAGYMVTCRFNCPAGVREVLMPSWSEDGGQDDLNWYRADVSGSTATLYVKTADHKNAVGMYYTHIYVYDKLGRFVLKSLEIRIPEDMEPEHLLPAVTEAFTSDVTYKGYQVTASFNAPAGLKEVVMATWTSTNGKDDLVVTKAQVTGNTATLYISVDDHGKQSGAYTTHIYIRDKAGREAMQILWVRVPVPPLRIDSLKSGEITSAGYRITASFEAAAGVKEVLVAVWTSKNGQDDLVWYTAGVSGNTATCYVPVSDHNGESGVYTTHVYVKDTGGRQVLAGLYVTVPAAKALEITDIKTGELTSAGYRVTVAFNAPAGVSQVLMPTWTAKNGQDDLVWHIAQISGNTASFYVSTAAHKGECGAYITHVYVQDKTGKQVIEGVEVTVPLAPAAGQKPSISKVTVTQVSSAGYQVTAVFDAPAGLKEVLMPSWSVQNGQDDIVWHKATVTGNTAICYISVSAHKWNQGEYLTHVYVYDVKGQQALQGVSVFVR